MSMRQSSVRLTCHLSQGTDTERGPHVVGTIWLCLWHNVMCGTGLAVWRARCGNANKLRAAICVLTNNFCQLPPSFTENYAVQPLKPRDANQSYERRQHCQFFHVRSSDSFHIDCVPAYGFGTIWCLLHFWYFKNTESLLTYLVSCVLICHWFLVCLISVYTLFAVAFWSFFK